MSSHLEKQVPLGPQDDCHTSDHFHLGGIELENKSNRTMVVLFLQLWSDS